MRRAFFVLVFAALFFGVQLFFAGFASAAGDIFECDALTPGGNARPGPYFQSVYHSYEVLDKELVRDYQRDACEYLTGDIGLVVNVEFYKNETELGNYLALLRAGGKSDVSGSNWRMTHSTMEFVTEYDNLGNPAKSDFYVYKPSAFFAEKTGNCLVQIRLVGGEPSFPASYNWEAIPNRGPYPSKREAQLAGLNYIMSDVVQRGEAIIANQQLAGFCTLSEGGSATASPSQTPSAPPTLSATPSPTPTPEPVCEAKGEIIFEPTQGVWQDDYNFSPAVGRQIVRNGLGQYAAELPMVKGRQSLIFGLKGADALDAAGDRDRKVVKIRANVTGTRSVFSSVRFTLSQGASQKRVYDTAPIVDLPILPPCGPVRAFEFDYPNELGMPQAAPFTFDEAGAYQLKAELVRFDNGKPSGVQTVVSGNVVETFAPRTTFLPATLNKTFSGAQGRALYAWTRGLAISARDYIPDYYPLAQGRRALPILIHPETQSYYDVIVAANKSWGAWWNTIGGNATTDELIRERYRRQAVAAAAVDRIGTGARLGNADRIIVVLPQAETLQLINLSIAGLAISRKVMIVAYSPTISPAQHDTVAHEFAHTLPFVWSSPQMRVDCGIDYHNDGNRTAHGFRITYGGAPASRAHVQPGGALSIMGPAAAVAYNATDYTIWNDQCTYANLARVLQVRPDPRLLLVRGTLVDLDGVHYAFLNPAYELDGVEPAKGVGSWWISPKDGGGNELSKNYFEPEWLFETEAGIQRRKVVAFSQEILFDEKMRVVEVYSPDGLEATLAVSPNAPRVKIALPQNGSNLEPSEGNVRVSWEASDADGDALKYSVFYSFEEGELWQEQAFETTQTSAEISLGDAPVHRVKVIATDGARSGEAIVQFATRAEIPAQATLQPQAIPADLGLESLSNVSIDLSFIPPEIASVLGSGLFEVKISDGREFRSFWFSIESGKIVSAQPSEGAAPDVAVALKRSVFDAVLNSVDSENAAKLALQKGAAKVASPDGVKQAAFETAAGALGAKDFSPAPDSQVDFHGVQATVVSGPGGRPALSIPNERYLPVMNDYGAPLGATTRMAIAQAEKSGLGFSKDAGIVAANPATGKPVVEPVSPRLASVILIGSEKSAAQAAYYGALGAKKAYENAIKKS